MRKKSTCTFLLAVLLIGCSGISSTLGLRGNQTISSNGIISYEKRTLIIEELKKRGDEVIAAQSPDGGWTVHILGAEYYNGSGGSDFMAISSAATGLLFLWYGTRDEGFLDAAKKALNFIVANQNPDGGWGIPYELRHWDHAHPAGDSYTVVTAQTAIALLRAKDILNTTEYDAALEKVLRYFDENFASQVGDTWTYCPKRLYPSDFQDVDMEIYVNNIDAVVCGVLSHPFMMDKAPYNEERVNAAVDHILSTQQSESPYGFPYGRDDSSVDMGYTCFTLWGLMMKNKYSPDSRIVDCARKIMSTYFQCAGTFEGDRTHLNGDGDFVALLPFDSWVTEGKTYYKGEEAARNALFRTTVLPLKDEQGRITRAGLSNLRSMTGYLALAYLAPTV